MKVLGTAVFLTRPGRLLSVFFALFVLPPGVEGLKIDCFKVEELDVGKGFFFLSFFPLDLGRGESRGALLQFSTGGIKGDPRDMCKTSAVLTCKVEKREMERKRKRGRGGEREISNSTRSSSRYRAINFRGSRRAEPLMCHLHRLKNK